MKTALNRHVADVLVAEGRASSAAEARHIATCDRCATTVRRLTAFEAQLRQASASLVVDARPLEPVQAPALDRRRRGAGALAAAAAGALVVGVVLVGGSSVVSPVAPGASAAPIDGRVDCGPLPPAECSLVWNQLRVQQMLFDLEGRASAAATGSDFQVTFLSETEATVTSGGRVIHVTFAAPSSVSP